MKLLVKNIPLFILLFFLSFGQKFRAEMQNREQPLSVQMKTYFELGWKYRCLNSDSSIFYLKKAGETAIRLHSPSNAAKTYNLLGVTYRNINKYDSAYYYYRLALEYAYLANDTLQIAYAYNNTSTYYFLREQFFLALEHALRANFLFQKINDLKGLGYSNRNLGKIHLTLGNYSDAIKYLNLSIKYRKANNDSAGMAVTKRVLAKVFMKQGKLAKAEKILREIIPVAEQNSMHKVRSLSYAYLGEIEFQRGNTRKAIENLQKSVEISKATKCEFCLTEEYNTLAEIYLKTGNYETALDYLHKAERLARKNEYYSEYIRSLHLFLRYYADSGKDDKILEYTNKITAIKDSLSKEEAKLRNKEFKKLFTLNRLKKKNAILSGEEKAKTKIIVMFSGLGIIFLGFLTIVIVQNRKIKQRTNELKKAIADKNKLFSIIAHDLKNPFASLLGYADFLLEELEEEFSIEEIKNAIKHMRSSTRKLLDMVENLLEWAKAQSGNIRFSPEVHEINDILLETSGYFSQSASAKNVQLKLHLTPNFKCYCDKQMVNTILRNLISNAIKFTHAGDYVKVYAEKDKENDKLIVYVEDSGIGMNEEQLQNIFEKGDSRQGTSGEAGTGLGLALVKEMVEKNNGEIFVTSKAGVGTKFAFTLPLA